MNNKVILASNNKNKIIEYTEILKDFGIEVISQKEAGFNTEIEETGKTFAENAILKAEAIYKQFGQPVISDDSGIEIDYLDKMPGVYSHRFLRRKYSTQRKM